MPTKAVQLQCVQAPGLCASMDKTVDELKTVQVRFPPPSVDFQTDLRFIDVQLTTTLRNTPVEGPSVVILSIDCAKLNLNAGSNPQPT